MDYENKEALTIGDVNCDGNNREVRIQFHFRQIAQKFQYE
jgi:hypothetical protein